MHLTITNKTGEVKIGSQKKRCLRHEYDGILQLKTGRANKNARLLGSGPGPTNARPKPWPARPVSTLSGGQVTFIVTVRDS